MKTLHEYLRERGVEGRGKNWVVRCPVHEDSNASCSVAETCWTCFGCGAKGGIVDFIEADQQCSRYEAGRIAGLGLELVGNPADRIRAARATIKRAPMLKEVQRMWAESTQAPEDLLAKRCLGTPSMDLVRLAPEARPEWAEHWARRLVVPLYDVKGSMRSMVGRSMTGTIKTMVPTGFSTSGLCMLSPAVQAGIRLGVSLSELWICEGEIDYLTCCRYHSEVMGIRNGSWSDDWRRAVEAICASVVVATDPDDAGDRYAAEIGIGKRWRKDVDLNEWVSRGDVPTMED